MWQYIVLGSTYAFAAVLQPGPFQAYLLSQSLKKGLKRTLPAAFAPVLSDGPIIVLVLLLLSAIPGWFVNVLQIAGGIFLLYLAFAAYRNREAFDIESEVRHQTGQQTLFKAVIVNLLNPSPYIGWSLIMGPLLIKGWKENPSNGVALVISFYATIVAGLAVSIILFSSFRSMGLKFSKILTIISVIALAYFGVFALWSGAASFISK